MAAAQAVVPAEAGASALAELLKTSTLAESDLPTLSVTVTRNVTEEPDVGASRVAVGVLAPSRAGGFVVGATTVHA